MNKVAPDDDHVKLSVGDRVRRSKDGKWGDDGNTFVGVVTEALDENGFVSVTWDQAGSDSSKHVNPFLQSPSCLFVLHPLTCAANSIVLLQVPLQPQSWRI